MADQVKPPRPQSVLPEAQLNVYVDIPVMSIYNQLSFFPKSITVKDAIMQLSVHMNDREKKALSRYHLFFNGLRMMDESRTLTTYNIKNNSCFCMDRAEEYEFTCSDQSLVYVGDVSVLEAGKILTMQSFPALKNFNLYDFILTKNDLPLDPALKILLARLADGDSLVLQIKSKQNPNQNIPTAAFVVSSSPFSNRLKQKKAFAKTGIFKKQGVSNRSWKERYFVLDGDKLQYFDPKKKNKPALGTVYLDEVTSVDIQETMTGNGNWFFEIKVPGRNLLIFTRDEQMMREWMNAIMTLSFLARQELMSYSNDELNSNLEARDLDRIRGSVDRLAKAGTISGPLSVKHLSHITADWQWAGDVSVFQLDEVLGKGVSGTVLKAFVRDCNFTVAIKIVSLTNKKVQEELKKEIEVLKKCKHPNIVAYYGTYLGQNDEVWIIMDYCGAGSLKDLLKVCQDTCSEKQTKHVLSGTVKGLHHLHQRGILHLDIKGANILVTDEGDIKLADFGVSTQLSTHTTFVSATDYIGSPLFMSPEVVRKDKYNSSSDIWSLGITVIEMVDGFPPNTDIVCVEMLPLINSRDPPTLKNPKQWSADLNDIIACMLKKDPNERPACIDLLAHKFLDMANLPQRDCMNPLLSMSRSIKSNKK